jgi:DNA (cytosine-5)-methyltransferase 1
MAENVPGLTSVKFRQYLYETFYQPLSREYVVTTFHQRAEAFGVPQRRERAIFVGFRRQTDAARFLKPEPTRDFSHLLLNGDFARNHQDVFPGFDRPAEKCMGARQALGLPDIGYDALAPTLRSSFTGPRGTTSVVNSKAAMEVWDRLQLWPNGVAATREAAARFPTKNGHLRLAVPDCKVLQGFPGDWSFSGPTFKQLGQLGNSVPPPLAYRLALSIAAALDVSH